MKWEDILCVCVCACTRENNWGLLTIHLPKFCLPPQTAHKRIENTRWKTHFEFNTEGGGCVCKRERERDLEQRKSRQFKMYLDFVMDLLVSLALCFSLCKEIFICGGAFRNGVFHLQSKVEQSTCHLRILLPYFPLCADQVTLLFSSIFQVFRYHSFPQVEECFRASLFIQL